jgi:CHAD domain-containing protein
MTATRTDEKRLAAAFERNVATLDSRLEEFLSSGDSSSTAALRKAARRLQTTYSVLPKRVRRDKSVGKYVGASRSLAKAVGEVRDVDTIASWSTQLREEKDRKSFAYDLDRLRKASLRLATRAAKELKATKRPVLELADLKGYDYERRVKKVERRLSRRVDKEFEKFLSTQEVDAMHALRKDSKRLRHLLELVSGDAAAQFLQRLRLVQDDLGAIRDHDLVIEYLRSRVRLTNTRSLIREEIAMRHARLEDFVTKNRGQGHLVPPNKRLVEVTA